MVHLDKPGFELVVNHYVVPNYLKACICCRSEDMVRGKDLLVSMCNQRPNTDERLHHHCYNIGPQLVRVIALRSDGIQYVLETPLGAMFPWNKILRVLVDSKVS
eukprot:6596002-Pyramimonas_sp.AAC.1